MVGMGVVHEPGELGDLGQQRKCPLRAFLNRCSRSFEVGFTFSGMLVWVPLICLLAIELSE